jgi:MFS family permease
VRASPAPAAVGFGPRFVAPLFIGSMLNPVNSTMIAVALIPIGRSYHVGVAATVWLVSSLYLASAIAQPVLGEVADRFGARRVYVSGLVVVGIAGLGGALVPSLWLLVTVRVAIGIGTSAAYPTAIAMVRQQSRRLGRETPGGVLGVLSIGSLASAAIGPALGGILVGEFGWRSIFVVNAPLALSGLAMTFRWLPADQAAARETGDRSTWRALDVPGIAAFGATLTVLLVFLMGLANPDWLLLAAFVVLGAVLARWELSAPRPFLDLRMLAANRPLVITYIRYGLTFLIIYGMLYGFPQWMEQARGLNP